MLIYILAIPLIAHGLANLAGVFAPWSKGLAGFADAAWAFSGGVTYASWAGRSFSPIWLASSACLLAAGVGLLQRQSFWPLLAILGCGLSALAILPWWRAVPPGARFGAIFDLVMILVLVSPLRGALLARLAAG